jgi:hypothetical protein
LFIPATNFVERATNESLERRRYYDDTHFEAYLKKMKEVNHLLPSSPTHCYPEMVSMVGVIGPHFFDELLLTL